MTKDVCAAHAPLRYASPASLFTGAKEAKFPFFSKDKPVSFLLISKSSHIILHKSSFCATDSKWCASHWRMRDAYFSRPPAGTDCMFDSQQKGEKSVYSFLNIDIFLTKMHGFATGGLYSTPETVRGTVYYGCMHFIWLLLDGWTKTPSYSHYNTWKSQDNI